ncbi:MAG TPA: MFS transporter [Xanthobacteraceae bacterium]|jgi:MFS family permease|nr:MFS transporter [Xanthobacteraceae bacterium]
MQGGDNIKADSIAAASSDVRRQFSWRTPALILACGCLIALIGFGARSGLGFFLTPMSSVHGWGRDVFALALAIQMLLWGAAQPVAGALADRYGAMPVLSVGAMLYALGLAAMAYASTPAMLHLTAGAVIGFGLAGSSFTVVIGAFGKLMPPQWRSLAFGAGTAAGSFGQFVFSPLAVALIDGIGWQDTLVAFAAVVLLIMPLSLALASPRQAGGPIAPTSQTQQSVAQALSEALGHKSYVLLVLGFFTCGFQIFFIAVHLPAYLVDRGLPAEVGGWTLASIGLFNIIGAVVAGWLAAFTPKRYILSLIYVGRAAAILIYILLPPSTLATLIFGAVMGLFWLSTVPPTSGLVAVMFGTRWLAMLFGFAFFSHQVGGFLGVWLGGVLFESSGSYDVVWWLSILLGLLSAVINLPIVERPVARLAPA